MLIPLDHHVKQVFTALVEKIFVQGSFTSCEGSVHDLVRGGLVGVGVFVVGMMKRTVMFPFTEHSLLNHHSAVLLYLDVTVSLLM